MRGTTTTRPGPVKTRAAGCTTPRARTNTHHKHWTKKMGPDRIHLEIQLSKSMVKTGAEFHGNSRTYGRWKTFSNKFSDFWSRDFSPRGGGGTGVRKP